MGWIASCAGGGQGRGRWYGWHPMLKADRHAPLNNHRALCGAASLCSIFMKSLVNGFSAGVNSFIGAAAASGTAALPRAAAGGAVRQADVIRQPLRGLMDDGPESFAAQRWVCAPTAGSFSASATTATTPFRCCAPHPVQYSRSRFVHRLQWRQAHAIRRCGLFSLYGPVWWPKWSHRRAYKRDDLRLDRWDRSCLVGGHGHGPEQRSNRVPDLVGRLYSSPAPSKLPRRHGGHRFNWRSAAGGVLGIGQPQRLRKWRLFRRRGGRHLRGDQARLRVALL